MANRYPLILNGVKFYINPKNLSIEKPLQVGELLTQGGVQYQIWYDHPETLTIIGVSAGDTAYRELLFLKNSYEVGADVKTSELFYKTKTYIGFIRNIRVGHTLDEHLRFPYTIIFQLLQGQRFNLQDFALNSTGALSGLEQTIEQKIGAPIAGLEQGLNNFFGKII